MKRLFKQLHEIAGFYGVELDIISVFEGAYADLREDRVVLGTVGLTRDEFVTAFFHELGHFYCKYNNKFKIYHDIKPIGKCSIRELKAWVNTSLRAERYADKIGKELMKFYYPGIDYQSGYSDELAIIRYRANTHLPILVEIRRRELEGLG